MKNKSELLRVLLFSFFGIFLMCIVYMALNKLSLSRHDSYIVKDLFTDLKQLQIGDDVRVAGVRVGSVVDTYLNKDLAVAILSIENKYQIPENSTATLLMAGLLGANYVAITPGNSEKALMPEAYLNTQKTLDISSVIQKFGSVGDRLDRILSGFDKEGESNVLADIGNFFHDNKDKLGKIIDDIACITEKISHGQGTLGHLVCDDSAHSSFVDTMSSIRGAANKVDSMLQAFDEISKNLKEGKGLLGKLISDPELSQSFDKIVKNIEEFSNRLNDTKSTLGRIISTDSLYKKAESTLDKVDSAMDGITNSGPITAVGAAASAIF